MSADKEIKPINKNLLMKRVNNFIETNYSPNSIVEPTRPSIEESIKILESFVEEPLQPYQKKLIELILTTESVITNGRVHHNQGGFYKNGRQGR